MVQSRTFFCRLLALTLSAVSVPLPLLAQSGPTPIAADAKADWTHSASGIDFPASMLGLPRLGIVDFDTGQWDVSAEYGLPELSTALSVYVYQAAIQDASMLFAESRLSLEGRTSHFGVATPLTHPETFIPPRQVNASGIRMTYVTTGSFKSTALAVAPLTGEWVVKFRLSSKDKSAAELDRLLSAAIAEFKWPNVTEPRPTAFVIADCKSILPPLKRSKPVSASQNMNAALFGGMFNLPLGAEAHAPAKMATPYCHDASFTSRFNVYRHEDIKYRYAVSLGDSGRAIIVEPDVGDAILSGGKKAASAFSIRFVQPGSSLIFQSQKTQPPPDQAVEIVEKGKWLSRSSRGAGDNDVNINADALK
jgi:hypothetical protein